MPILVIRPSSVLLLPRPGQSDLATFNMTGQDESDQDHDKRGREARGPRAVNT
jgi:hypothetical protein